MGKRKPHIGLNGIYQSCSHVRQLVITLHTNDWNAKGIKRPFLLEWKVFTCAFWRMWPLPISGALMQVDNNGIDKWSLIQSSWLSLSLSLHFQPLPTSSPCIWSSLCFKCSSPKSSCDWPLIEGSDQKPSSLIVHSNFSITLVFWMDAFLCFQTSAPLFASCTLGQCIKPLSISISVNEWVCVYPSLFQKDLRQPSLFTLFRCFPFVIPWYFFF